MLILLLCSGCAQTPDDFAVIDDNKPRYGDYFVGTISVYLQTQKADQCNAAYFDRFIGQDVELRVEDYGEANSMYYEYMCYTIGFQIRGQGTMSRFVQAVNTDPLIDHISLGYSQYWVDLELEEPPLPSQERKA